MVQLLYGVHGTTLNLTSDIFVNNSAVKARLDELSSRADELSLLGLRTRDSGLVQACWEWRSLCMKAGLSILTLPTADDEGIAEADAAEGMVSMTLILGGVLGSVEDLEPLEREAYMLCEQVGDQCRELLRKALDLSDMEIPPFLQTGDALQREHIGVGEQKLMTDIVHGLFRSIGADSVAAESVGSALIESSLHRTDLQQEMTRLEVDCLEETAEEERPRIIGEVVLNSCASESDEREYPLLAIEAMSLIIGRNTTNSPT